MDWLVLLAESIAHQSIPWGSNHATSIGGSQRACQEQVSKYFQVQNIRSSWLYAFATHEFNHNDMR